MDRMQAYGTHNLIQSGHPAARNELSKETLSEGTASAKKSHETVKSYNIAIPAQSKANLHKLPIFTCLAWSWSKINRVTCATQQPKGFTHGLERSEVATRTNDAVVLGLSQKHQQLTTSPIKGETRNKGNKIKAKMPSTTPCTIVSAINKGII